MKRRTFLQSGAGLLALGLSLSSEAFSQEPKSEPKQQKNYQE